MGTIVAMRNVLEIVRRVAEDKAVTPEEMLERLFLSLGKRHSKIAMLGGIGGNTQQRSNVTHEIQGIVAVDQQTGGSGEMPISILDTLRVLLREETESQKRMSVIFDPNKAGSQEHEQAARLYEALYLVAREVSNISERSGVSGSIEADKFAQGDEA
jgi:hypothetical protein